MKRGKDPQFKAVQRARRLRGELGVRFGTSGLRDEAGGMASHDPEDDEPVYPLGLCPDCDLGGPAAIALIPGEQCQMCGGYPAGEQDDLAPPPSTRSSVEPTVRQRPGRVRDRSVPVAPSSDGRSARALLRAAFPDWSRADHEAAAERFKDARDRLDEAWNQRWQVAFRKRYGRDPEFGDYRVSGIGDDGLPDEDKNVLRSLSRASTRAHYLTDAHRAAGRFLRRGGGEA